MKNKLLLTVMATSLMIPVIVAPLTVDAQTTYSKTFKDISKNSDYYDIIHEMAQQGIINGYPDGTFKPLVSISRQHAAALINRAVKLTKVKTFKAPNDLSSKNPYYYDMKALLEAGLLEIDNKGNVNPNEPLTRGEMAKILATAFKLNSTGSKHPLKDVSKKYDSYVTALYNAGVTTGFEDKTFKENASLTRAHYAVFMYRAMNLKTTPKLEEVKSQNVKDYPTDKVTARDRAREKGVSFMEVLNTPGGYENRFNFNKEQEKESYRLTVEIGVMKKWGKTFNPDLKKDSEFNQDLAWMAEKMGIEKAELIQIINYAEATGNVYNGGTFWLRIEYVNGLVEFGIK